MICSNCKSWDKEDKTCNVEIENTIDPICLLRICALLLFEIRDLLDDDSGDDWKGIK